MVYTDKGFLAWLGGGDGVGVLVEIFPAGGVASQAERPPGVDPNGLLVLLELPKLPKPLALAANPLNAEPVL